MTHPLRVQDDGRDKVEEDVIAIGFLSLKRNNITCPVRELAAGAVVSGGSVEERLTHIFQFGSGHFQLVQTLEEHSLTFLLHVVIGSFLGVGEGGEWEEGEWV